MIPPVYFVTDPDAPLPVPDQALAAARGGCTLIQLRDKTASDDALVALAREMKAALAAQGARLIINDRVEVALRAGLYGLHIGQSDGDPALIRARIGPGMVLGLSIENAAQLARVPAGFVNYFGVGPVRATATKPDHAPPLGFDGLADIVGATKLPCVAIGGLGAGDAPELKAAGVDGMAVVSAISRAKDPQAATRNLVNEWSNT